MTLGVKEMLKEDNMSDTTKINELAESYVKRAWNKCNEAEESLKRIHYAESVSASQECIELSLKAIFLLLEAKHSKRHQFSEGDFERIIEKIPEKLRHLELPKLYLYSRFWSSFYTTAKYGLGKIGVGPEKLFEKEEADLALKHAQDCRNAASQLENYLKHPW